MAQIKSRYLDRRTMDRYIEKGLISADEVKSYIKSLPDEAANAQYVQMDLHDAEISEDSDLGIDEDGEEEGA